MQRTYGPIRLELGKTPIVNNPSLNFVRGDIDVYSLEIHLLEEGVPFAIPDGAEVHINFRPLSGTERFRGAAEVLDADAGKIKYTIVGDEISVPGTVSLEAEVSTPTQLQTWTQRFNFGVVDPLRDSNATPPEPMQPWVNQVDTRLTALEEGGGGGTPPVVTEGITVQNDGENPHIVRTMNFIGTEQVYRSGNIMDITIPTPDVDLSFVYNCTGENDNTTIETTINDFFNDALHGRTRMFMYQRRLNTNSPRYIFVNGLFGVILKR